jgi:hypothetical protein
VTRSPVLAQRHLKGIACLKTEGVVEHRLDYVCRASQGVLARMRLQQLGEIRDLRRFSQLVEGNVLRRNRPPRKAPSHAQRVASFLLMNRFRRGQLFYGRWPERQFRTWE